MITHLTTVHPRDDIRIATKQCASLAKAFPGLVRLVVADGKGAAHRSGVEIVDLGTLPRPRFGRGMHGFWRAVRYLRATRPALVHFHDPELIFVGLVAKSLGISVIYDVHEDVPRQIMARPDISRLLRPALIAGAFLAEWVGSRMFDALVPATHKIAERFPPRKTFVIQNFPLISELTPVQPRPYNERPASFVYVGGISRLRGLKEMIEAVGRLESTTQAQLDLAGKFSPESLQEEAAHWDGYARTRLHGWLSRGEVAELLSLARAGLVVLHPAPNHVNSQPNKLFEYMSAGLPVIASKFPLWEQIVGGVGCGLLVDPLDPGAIADAMRWVLEHPREAQIMGQRGQAAVEATFNWSSEQQRLIDLYQRILRSRVALSTSNTE